MVPQEEMFDGFLEGPERPDLVLPHKMPVVGYEGREAIPSAFVGELAVEKKWNNPRLFTLFTHFWTVVEVEKDVLREAGSCLLYPW